ncbi:secretory lipase [Nocardia tenerifensis]|uniref:Secretory lipase n=1 Tax=Nocardia tenerifensis TaxID=228006 RepID=A0A318KHX1_9NOCA|nr:lipase family protein [Nocardia tenerifensis]PXX66743.1 secretory lipase [Nocardia tenerifensis]
MATPHGIGRGTARLDASATSESPVRRRLARFGSSAAAAAVLLLASSFVTVPDALAQVPPPDADPFYAAPADLAAYPEGAIVESRQSALFGLPLPISTWQVKYRSTDASGVPVADVATVMVPMMAWNGPGARPLLSYQVAEDSLGSRCAPSYALRGGGDPGGAQAIIDTPFMIGALLRGWAVVASDHEGPRSRFLDGVNSGRGVLDGIRAARDLPAAGLGPATPVVGWGYSGGAFATLWAAQIQRQYAPDIRLAGLAAGGVPSNWPAIGGYVDGTMQAGLAMLIVLAAFRDNPSPAFKDLLNDRGRAAVAADGAACGPDLVAKYLNARVDDFASVPNLLAHPAFRAATDPHELGAPAPAVPMYLYHSTTDDIVPVAGFTDLLARYCAQGATITSAHSTLPGHNPTAAGEALGALSYLADRVAGVPVAPGCHER